MFLIIDGIDGSGKSTVLEAWKKYLTSQGNAIFDLKEYWKKTGHYPELSEIKSYDFIFSAEPTYVGMGKVIREELIKNGTKYSTEAIAEAYSLDRLILYTKIIIPLLKEGKCVIQDRGVTTSVAYQSLGKNGLAMNKIAKLPGNALAIKNRPDYLVLLKISAKATMERLRKRLDKKDNVIFERLKFQEQARKKFLSSAYQNIFTKAGSKIHCLNAETKIDIMNKEAVDLLRSLLH